MTSCKRKRSHIRSCTFVRCRVGSVWPSGSRVVTGSPEAVTRLQLPQIVACGVPARRASEEASPHRLRLQPCRGQAELRTLERRGALDGEAHLAPHLGLLAAATEPLAPVALDAAGDAPKATEVARSASVGLGVSQARVEWRGWLVERCVPHPLPPLMACRQTAPPSSLVRAPAPLEVATAVARAGPGHAQTRARLPAGPVPRGLAFGHAPERHPAGVTRLARHSALGQACDQPLWAAVRVSLRLDTHDDRLARAPQGGVAWPPWLHHPLAPQVQPVVTGEVAQDDAALPPVRDPVVAGLDEAVCPHAGVQPPPDQAHEAWVSDSGWPQAPAPSLLSAPEAMAPVGLVDPAHWRPRDDRVACRPCLVRPHARSATTGARENIRLVEGRQHVSHAPLEDAVPEARHPQRAPLTLPRLRDGGPTPRRWPVALGVHHAPRGFTPDRDILRQGVRGLALTARRRLVRPAAAVRPPPLGLAMRRQPGHATRWRLPSVRGDPCASCAHAGGVPLWAQRPVTALGMARMWPSIGASAAGRFPWSWALPIAADDQPV